MSHFYCSKGFLSLNVNPSSHVKRYCTGSRHTSYMKYALYALRIDMLWIFLNTNYECLRPKHKSFIFTMPGSATTSACTSKKLRIVLIAGWKIQVIIFRSRLCGQNFTQISYITEHLSFLQYRKLLNCWFLVTYYSFSLSCCDFFLFNEIIPIFQRPIFGSPLGKLLEFGSIFEGSNAWVGYPKLGFRVLEGPYGVMGWTHSLFKFIH